MRLDTAQHTTKTVKKRFLKTNKCGSKGGKTGVPSEDPAAPTWPGEKKRAVARGSAVQLEKRNNNKKKTKRDKSRAGTKKSEKETGFSFYRLQIHTRPLLQSHVRLKKPGPCRLPSHQISKIWRKGQVNQSHTFGNTIFKNDTLRLIKLCNLIKIQSISPK